MRDAPTDQLYVGYLPLPVLHRRFLRWLVPAVLWGLCAAAFFWARSQHSPGDGIWDQGRPLQLSGTLISRPYPMLIVQSPSADHEAILLVEAGKRGGEHNIAALDGRAVTVSGWPLHRDGRRMLELEPGDTALRLEGQLSKPPAPSISLGPVTLRGEIVDAKCFLGAMKPGEGKAHKECATLCIKGGIPPMLVEHDASGRATYTVLAGPDGGPLEVTAHPFVGDFVEVTGELSEQSGLRILRLSAKNIRRL